MFMPDPILRANEAYYGRIVVVDANTGEFTLTDKGRSEMSITSYVQSSLAGLEHYPNLKLIGVIGDAVQDRNLSEVDVRAMRKLEYLVLQTCPKVRVVRANDMPNIRKITISNSPKADNVALEEIYAQGCPNLDTLICNDGKLTKLDVSGDVKLKNINVYGNQLTRITGVEDCVSMLDLTVNRNQLTSLDVSRMPDLINLRCADNKLTELNADRNREIAWLSCGNNDIGELKIGHMTDLERLFVGNTKITELDIQTKKLVNAEFWQTPIANLNLSGQTELLILYCFGMPDLQTLNISGCSQLGHMGFTDASGDGNAFSGSALGIVDLTPKGNATPSFREFIADGCAQIKGLRSENNATIERISIRNCSELRSVILLGNSNLRYLDVTGNSLNTYEATGSHSDFQVVGIN
jgi:Leucine-rich repeat (LRR) protein